MKDLRTPDPLPKPTKTRMARLATAVVRLWPFRTQGKVMDLEARLRREWEQNRINEDRNLALLRDYHKLIDQHMIQPEAVTRVEDREAPPSMDARSEKIVRLEFRPMAYAHLFPAHIRDEELDPYTRTVMMDISHHLCRSFADGVLAPKVYQSVLGQLGLDE